MCNFLSALAMENGDIICDPTIDSHEDLIKKINLKDGILQQDRFARVEFLPPMNYSKWEDLTQWELRLDEIDPPSWWNEKKEDVRRKLELIVKNMTIKDEKRDVLDGGYWVLLGNTEIGKVTNARVRFMRDNSLIKELGKDSIVEYMYDNSKIEHTIGNSIVEYMYDNSKIEHTIGDSTVEDMYGSSKVINMHHNSKIEETHDNSIVEHMYDSSKIIINGNE